VLFKDISLISLDQNAIVIKHIGKILDLVVVGLHAGKNKYIPTRSSMVL
jgi:hypothetical protein